MKALGTGWTRGVRWVDIEVVRASGGPPELVLHGESAAIARSRGIERWHVTITHDAGIAAAVVVAESSAVRWASRMGAARRRNAAVMSARAG
jgi:holo-[acyl-carrier protein] synthase